VTGPAGSAAPSQGDGAADGEEPADQAVPPLPRRIPGQASKFWPGRQPGTMSRPGAVPGPPGACGGEPGGSWPEAPAWLVPQQRAAAGKPTPAELGIDLAALEWERSGDGEGRVEVAFPAGPASGAATWSRGEWVLMRVTGDPARRVLVFDRNEWECFLDGVRNGEFDDAV
jgi:Domain of unknown function (DUF397)